MVPLTDHGYEILNTKPKKAIDYHSVEMMSKLFVPTELIPSILTAYIACLSCS